MQGRIIAAAEGSMVNLRRCHGLVAAADKVSESPLSVLGSKILTVESAASRLSVVHLAVQVVSRLLLITRLTAIPHATSMSDVSHLSYMLICPDATK